jgi:hypothetical protein
MIKAARLTASALGIAAGLLGVEHGVFEALQGNLRTGGVVINAFGPSCQPAEVWHGCEPAMTLIPNYVMTGLCAILVGAVVAYWAGFQIARKHGGEILIFLNGVLLLVGGGLAPVMVGIIAGILGARIDKQHTWWKNHIGKEMNRFLAKAWLWFLIPLLIWMPGEWILGIFFNDFLIRLGFLPTVAVLAFIFFSSVCAISFDVENHAEDTLTGGQIGRVWYNHRMGME